MKCHTPIVNFGLVKVNTSENFNITIENTSPIEAVTMIKKSKNEKLTFENMLSLEEARNSQNFDISHVPLIYDRPFQTDEKNRIIFENYGIML